MTSSAAHDAVVATFRWVDGHADVWRLFGDPRVFALVVEHLAQVAKDAAATKVAGIESRGFILGGAVAHRAGVGLVPVRKDGGLFPGDKLRRRADADYRGQRHVLQLQRAAVGPADRVLLVDDWAERGSQALAAKHLVEAGGARWAGAALVVDQLDESTRNELSPVAAIVHARELGPSG